MHGPHGHSSKVWQPSVGMHPGQNCSIALIDSIGASLPIVVYTTIWHNLLAATAVTKALQAIQMSAAATENFQHSGLSGSMTIDIKSFASRVYTGDFDYNIQKRTIPTGKTTMAAQIPHPLPFPFTFEGEDVGYQSDIWDEGCYSYQYIVHKDR